MMGYQSTMERPERVSRVMPPTTTMASTKPAHTKSQVATDRRPATGLMEGKLVS